MSKKIVRFDLLGKDCKSKIIEYCDSCPLNCTDWEDCKYCVLGGSVKPLGDNTNFPTDCPLPDYKDEQKYKAKVEFSVSATFDETERNFETIKYCIIEDVCEMLDDKDYDLISDIKITEIKEK